MPRGWKRRERGEATEPAAGGASANPAGT